MRESNQFGLLRLIQFSEEETTSIESFGLIHIQIAIKLLLFDCSMHSEAIRMVFLWPNNNLKCYILVIHKTIETIALDYEM